jgi:cyclase
VPPMDRRDVLRLGLAGLAGLTSTALWSAPATRPTRQVLAGKLTLIAGVPGNVLALAGGDGVLLVDSGAASAARALKAVLGGARVRTIFNTHHHADQTGGNALFGKDGAQIHAHAVTRQWLSTDYYVPAENRWVKALPPEGRPTVTFRDQGQMTVDAEHVEFGYLLEAHTRGDIYVFFRDSNVLAVGDVASPLRDPALDWYAGGWLGGRVDAMDQLLALANEATQIVPAYGPVMTRAQLKAERDMTQHLYERTTDLTDHGRSAKDMLEAGVMGEIERKFQDPYRFLYDVSKGLWAHYTNFGGNIV